MPLSVRTDALVGIDFFLAIFLAISTLVNNLLYFWWLQSQLMRGRISHRVVNFPPLAEQE